jgi:hypothetical protein
MRGAIACEECHPARPGVSTPGHADGSTTARAADHPNGVKNVGGAGSQVNSWNAATLTCAPARHGSERW